MLRDFITISNSSPIKQILDEFEGVLSQTETQHIILIEFKVLTPDSFVWKLLINDTIYYLYAEDHVLSLNDIRSALHHAYKKPTEFEFINANITTDFDHASPVTSAAIYKEPRDKDELMKLAVPSGYDFVFLCKSNEDAREAYFSS